MKSFKLLLSVLALVAFAAAPALRAQTAPATPPPAGAPDHKEKGGHRGERLKELTEKLGLTDAQVAQIKPILQDEMAAMKALKDEPASADKKAKMMEIRKSHREQIIAILTPEQQAKFKEGMQERRKGAPDAPKSAK